MFDPILSTEFADRFPSDIRDELDGRFLEGDGTAHLGKLIQDRNHHWRLESMRHVELDLVYFIFLLSSFF